MQPPITPKSLLRKLADPDAPNGEWARFLDLYAPIVRAWLSYHRLPDDELDDAAQEVYIRLVRHLPASPYDASRAHFRTYLGRVVRSVAIDRLRRLRAERERRPLVPLPPDYADTIPDPDTSIEIDIRLRSRLLIAANQAAIDQLRRDASLTPTQRAILEACIIGDETPTQAARRLGIPPNTAVQTVNRLKARLLDYARALIDF